MSTKVPALQPAGKVPTDLPDIGPYILDQWTLGNESLTAAIEARLNVGVALNTARKKCKSNKGYGEWFENQQFPFQRRQGNNLQRMGANKAKVLKALKAQLADGEDPNYTKALAVAEGKALPAASGNGLPDDDPDDDDDPATAEPLPTEPLPKKEKSAKAALDMAGGRLNDEAVTNLLIQFESNVIPWIEKAVADGVDKATAATLEAFGQVLFEASQLCEKVAGTADDEGDE